MPIKLEKGIKAVVTGGAGFIGSHLVEALLAKGCEVHVVDDLSAGKKEHVPASAVFHKVDVLDGQALEGIFIGTSVVFHLAAIPSVQLSLEKPAETQRVHVDGTLSVLMAAKAAGVKRVVFSSSSAIYGDQDEKDFQPIAETAEKSPKSPYAMHKLMGELQCDLWSRVYEVETVCLRYFNVYGPRQASEGAYASVVIRFLNQAKAGKPLTITGDGKQTRDFVHVKDVVRANVAAAEAPLAGAAPAFNIGGGTETSVLQIAELIGGPTSFLPPRIEPKRSLADISKAKKHLHWQPEIGLKQGLSDLKRSMGL